MEKIRITREEMKRCLNMNRACFVEFRHLTMARGLDYDKNMDINTEITKDGDMFLWNVQSKNQNVRGTHESPDTVRI